MNTLLLPKGPEESVSNFIIIGANGSGKSHLGVWIEENQGEDINFSTKSTYYPKNYSSKERRGCLE